MSRVAKSPITLPEGVEISIDSDQLTVKGKKETLNLRVNKLVEIKTEDGIVRVLPRQDSQESWAMAGTFRSLVNGMIVGVTDGYVRKLDLVGVGYRAKVQGNQLNLTLGYSHPVVYDLPDGISAETPSQTEIVLKGSNKQLLGQVAAKVRGFRPPEPYQGKGIRYSDERVSRKEAKKK